MTPADRKRIQSVQAYLVAHKAMIGYEQHRPMGTRRISTMADLEHAVKAGFDMDCSESGVLVCHVSGVKSPTGSWSLGNTETYLQHLTSHYFDAREALPGAFCVLNADRPLSEQHVVMCHEKDPKNGDPIVFTHGTAADPSFTKFLDIKSAFPGRAVWLSVAHL